MKRRLAVSRGDGGGGAGGRRWCVASALSPNFCWLFAFAQSFLWGFSDNFATRCLRPLCGSIDPSRHGPRTRPSPRGDVGLAGRRGARSALRRQRCQGLPWQTRARQLYRRRAPAVGVFAKHRLRGGVVGQLGGASWRRVPRRGGVGGKAEAGGREPEGESGAPPPASANAHASSPSTFSVDGF